MILFVQSLLIYNAIHCSICLMSASSNLHQWLVRSLFIHPLQEMLHLKESCNSPFLKGVKKPIFLCQLHTHSRSFFIITHYRIFQSQKLLSPAVRDIPCSHINHIKVAPSPKLLTQSRTGLPVSSWFLVPIFLAKASENNWGSESMKAK